MLASNDQPVLEGKGSISSAAMKSVAEAAFPGHSSADWRCFQHMHASRSANSPELLVDIKREGRV
jgi:hypothetical protein